MCTPWTIPKLTSWAHRREWASCVFPCKLPSDDEPDVFHPSVPNSTIETRICVIKPGKNPSKHKSNKHRLIPVSIPIKDSEQPNNWSSRSHCQPFKEEDYIVFCVKEDGTFEVVRDEKSESAHHVKYKTEPSKTINRKLVYVEDIDTDSKYGNDGIDFDAINEDSDVFSDEEGEDEQSIYFDSEAPHPGIRVEAHRKKGNDDDDDDDESRSNYQFSQESNVSISTHSQNSTGSFVFPVLLCEQNGSPVKMPKPEPLHLRKHKPLRIGLQCCKF